MHLGVGRISQIKPDLKRYSVIHLYQGVLEECSQRKKAQDKEQIADKFRDITKTVDRPSSKIRDRDGRGTEDHSDDNRQNDQSG